MMALRGIIYPDTTKIFPLAFHNSYRLSSSGKVSIKSVHPPEILTELCNVSVSKTDKLLQLSKLAVSLDPSFH